MTASKSLSPPLQRLAMHPEALIAVPYDASKPFVALGTPRRFDLDRALEALGENPNDYWIGEARLAEGSFVESWDRTVSARFAP